MKKTILFISLLLFGLNLQAKVSLPKVEQFIGEICSRNQQLDPKWVRSILSQAKHQQSIIDAMNRPAEKTLKWFEYRKIFIQPKRIKQGVEFWQQHQQTLDQVSQTTGVPSEYIVAIIGVETFFGRFKGKHKVLDALYTLTFDYPKRAKFFRKELEQFLLLSNQQHVSALQAKGSYAGAMGYGQFMPSSYRSYAVDFEQDGVIDLLNNPDDAIASVANYLAKHHWQTGQQVAKNNASPPVQKVKKSGRFNQLKPNLTDNNGQKYTQLALKTAPDETEYWQGFQNFYVISRYNHSHLYVMAVHQLAQQLKAAKQNQPKDNRK